MRTLEEALFNPPRPGCLLSLSGPPGGGNKIYDRSPYGNIGVLTGATWVRAANGMWCLSFDGLDDYIDCGNPASLQIYTELTVKAWVSRLVDNGLHTIASKNSFNAKRCWFLRLGDNSMTNKMRFYVSKDGVGSQYLDGNTAVTGTGWHMVVATYRFITDGTSQIRIYLDGRLDGAQDNVLGDLYAENGVSVYIGCMLNASEQPYNLFNGKVALPQICRYIWQELQVKRAYELEKHFFGAW